MEGQVTIAKEFVESETDATSNLLKPASNESLAVTIGEALSDSTSLNTKKEIQLQEVKAEAEVSKPTVPEQTSAVLPSTAAESEAMTLSQPTVEIEEESCTMYCEITKDSEKARIDVTCEGSLPSESTMGKASVKKPAEDAQVGLEIAKLPDEESSKQTPLVPETAIAVGSGKKETTTAISVEFSKTAEVEGTSASIGLMVFESISTKFHIDRQLKPIGIENQFAFMRKQNEERIDTLIAEAVQTKIKIQVTAAKRPEIPKAAEVESKAPEIESEPAAIESKQAMEESKPAMEESKLLEAEAKPPEVEVKLDELEREMQTSLVGPDSEGTTNFVPELLQNIHMQSVPHVKASDQATTTPVAVNLLSSNEIPILTQALISSTETSIMLSYSFSLMSQSEAAVAEILMPTFQAVIAHFKFAQGQRMQQLENESSFTANQEFHKEQMTIDDYSTEYSSIHISKKNKPTQVEAKPAQAESKPTEEESKPTETELKPAQAEAKPAEVEPNLQQPEQSLQAEATKSVPTAEKAEASFQSAKLPAPDTVEQLRIGEVKAKVEEQVIVAKEFLETETTADFSFLNPTSNESLPVTIAEALRQSTSLNTKKESQLLEAKAEAEVSKAIVPEEVSAVLPSTVAESEAVTLSKPAAVIEEESCTTHCEITKDSEKARIDVTCEGSLPSESIMGKASVQKPAEDAQVGLEIAKVPEEESSKQTPLAPETAIEVDSGKKETTTAISAEFSKKAEIEATSASIGLMVFESISTKFHIDRQLKPIGIENQFTFMSKQNDERMDTLIAEAVQAKIQLQVAAAKRIEKPKAPEVESKAPDLESKPTEEISKPTETELKPPQVEAKPAEVEPNLQQAEQSLQAEATKSLPTAEKAEASFQSGKFPAPDTVEQLRIGEVKEKVEGQVTLAKQFVETETIADFSFLNPASSEGFSVTIGEALCESTSLNTRKESQLREAKAEAEVSKAMVPEEISVVLPSTAAESETATLSKPAVVVMEEESCTMYCEITKDSEKARIDVSCEGSLPSESTMGKASVKKPAEDAQVGLEIAKVPEEESSKQTPLVPETAIEVDSGKKETTTAISVEFSKKAEMESTSASIGLMAYESISTKFHIDRELKPVGIENQFTFIRKENNNGIDTLIAEAMQAKIKLQL